MYEIGNHYTRINKDCLDCAEREYNKLNGKKYLMDKVKNKIIMNTYGWENGNKTNK